MAPVGRAKDAEKRHVVAQSVRGPLISITGVAACMGGLSTGATTPEGLRRISAANRKHGRYTKDKLERQRRAAEVGRECKAKLKIIEQRLRNSGMI